MAAHSNPDDLSTSEGTFVPYELSYEEGWKLLDADARRYLDMSGEEFVRGWDAGEIDLDHPERHSAIVRVWMLLPAIRAEKPQE